MINISEKKRTVSEMVRGSSFLKLMDKQESLLANIVDLPDDVEEEDAKLLDFIEALIVSSESDSSVKETTNTFLKLDEIWRRKTADPNAAIDDLLQG